MNDISNKVNLIQCTLCVTHFMCDDFNRLFCITICYGVRLSDDILSLTFDTVQMKGTWSTQDLHARHLARSVSHLLHTVTRIVNVQSDAATFMTSRNDVTSPSPLLLKIDNTQCVGRCFTTARSAAMFLAVYRARQLGTLNITSVAGTSNAIH